MTTTNPRQKPDRRAPYTAYSSKKEIFEDYVLAVKFVLASKLHPTHREKDYRDFLARLARKNRLKIVKLRKPVRHLHSGGVSTGYFIEVEVSAGAGSNFILVGHESGPEFSFKLPDLGDIPLVGPAIRGANNAVEKYAEETVGKVLEHLTAKVSRFMRTDFPKIIHGGIEVEWVRVRSAHKGTVWIPFAQFDSKQVRCLAKNFNTVDQLIELRQKCFSGALVVDEKHMKALTKD